ncbi:hypothetical protein [Cytophaga hutchinsonii]|uniref:Uncharacterized protein n=1 Tax=Cytophaga hutchinsonii (strain ATCC 33406 / DSM 1761 / CIP 103989 / NBRC 15051 / NCIMB 9469 / D465) TaxID=269798 RepID=A0A6N4SSC2_CYTH3|nr:hypothetical protein [Cytophaga hutchinsonii]ABG59300.1 hypothetical protein CHU_2037 [Cytophaga hutchinsonii ATCC 33406]SFX32286.1 hypothetical protein SAMN04487930_1034 [Cytophaga hutchinsonii ATCC 33406]
MIRLINYILFLLLPVCSQAEEWNMVTIRDLYHKASVSKEDADKLKAALKSIQSPNECIKGYIAAAYMIEAKHVYNPSTKLSHFNNGKTLLDAAIKNDPHNIELKFIRVCIQTNAPSFLGYNRQIETDKAFIVSTYAAQTDLDLKKRIKEFMLQSGICTEQEKKTFK